jgi:hypothetical protein
MQKELAFELLIRVAISVGLENKKDKKIRS